MIAPDTLPRQTADALYNSQSLSDLVDSPVLTQDELDQESDRKLKKTYAYWFVGILIGQLIVMNLVFVAHGLGWLRFDELTLRFYTTSTILEVFGVIYIIVNNLFPSTKKPVQGRSSHL